ncbi:hypothetical protein GCM10010335_45470 [Streptomyces galbus]|nr:hypothetical protein GCM10010335_45470 [Streptomyces galbus]
MTTRVRARAYRRADVRESLYTVRPSPVHTLLTRAFRCAMLYA